MECLQFSINLFTGKIPEQLIKYLYFYNLPGNREINMNIIKHFAKK